MLSDRETFVSAIAVSLVSPVSKEISDEARKIILKHIRDVYCPSISDESWSEIYDGVKESLHLFDQNAFHGIVAHVSGVRVNFPKNKKVKNVEPVVEQDVESHVGSRVPEYEIEEQKNTVKLSTFPQKPDQFQKVSTSIQEKIRKINDITKSTKTESNSTFDKFISKLRENSNGKQSGKEAEEKGLERE